MNKKGFGAHSVLFLTFMLCSFLPAQNPSAFNNDTHKYVTQISAQIMSSKYSELKDDKYRQILEEYSLKPDEDENQGGYKFHFYNPMTERNFMGEKESALAKFKSHFRKAVRSYRKGRKDLAYQELGRSIHFLEDLNTPVHTGYDIPTDAVIKFPLHVSFEKICDQVSTSCVAVIPDEYLKYFEINSLSAIGKASAVLSQDNFRKLENSLDSDQKILAKNSVLNAQKKVSGLFHKFFRSTKK